MGKDTDLGNSVCQTRLQNPRRWGKKQDAGSLGPQMAEWYSVPLILDCSGRKREVTMKASCCPFVTALDLESACAQRMRNSGCERALFAGEVLVRRTWKNGLGVVGKALHSQKAALSFLNPGLILCLGYSGSMSYVESPSHKTPEMRSDFRPEQTADGACALASNSLGFE